MVVFVAFNLAILLTCAAVILRAIPFRLFRDFLRGLHFTIGITTPTDRQLRWTLVAWLASLIVIVDMMALLLRYVF
jgi:hypothetical protein